MNFATGRQEEEDSKTFVCQWRDGAITCVFCRDLHLSLMSTGLLKTGLFKGRWSLAESFFKQNYCHVCHTRFTVFSPLPSCCVFKTFYSDARQPNVTEMFSFLGNNFARKVWPNRLYETWEHSAIQIWNHNGELKGKKAQFRLTCVAEKNPLLKLPNREEKSSRHDAMVANVLDVKKPDKVT